MKNCLLFAILGILIFGANNSSAQSFFSSKEDVVEYLEGEWNLDVIHGGFAGGTYYLPTPFYFDSTVHRFVFESTAIDSTPLMCTTFIDDTLHQVTYISISENPSQIILPRWLLYNLPDNLTNYVGLMEDYGFYGFGQDTMVLGGNIPADGFDFGLSRLTTRTKAAPQALNIHIYPNPTDGSIRVDGIQANTPFELVDMNGKLVESGIWNDNFLFQKNKGIYILRLKIGKQWITNKLIIE